MRGRHLSRDDVLQEFWQIGRPFIDGAMLQKRTHGTLMPRRIDEK